MRLSAAWQVPLALLIAAGGAGSMTDDRPLLRLGVFEEPTAVAVAAASAPVLDIADPNPPAKTGIVESSIAADTPLPTQELAPLAAVLPSAVARKEVAAAIDREARQQGIPRELVEGVVRVESGFDPLAVGTVGEVGLMQIRPQTARMLGFSGETADLFQPDVNVRYAAAYLAGAWRLAKGDLCRTLMKYRAGHGEERMSTLSVEYCRRVRAHLESVRSPLALAILPKADFVSPGGAKFLGTGTFGSVTRASAGGLLPQTNTLTAMAGWRRKTGGRPAAKSSPASAYVEANRTPLYRAMLAGRS